MTWDFVRGRILPVFAASNHLRLLALLALFVLCNVIFFAGNVEHEHTLKPIETGSSCLDIVLSQFLSGHRRGDTFIILSSEFGSRRVAPLVGNGFVGLSFRESGLYLIDNSTFSVHLPVNLLASVRVDDHRVSPDALVVQYKEGIIHQIYTGKKLTSCWHVQQSVYAHRRLSSLIVQQIKLRNSERVSVSFHLQQDFSSTAHIETEKLPPQTASLLRKSYSVVSGEVHSSSPLTAYAVASILAPETKVDTEPESESIVELLSIVKRSFPKKSVSPSVLALEASQELLNIHFSSQTALFSQHSLAWHEIWRSSVSVLSEYHPNTPSNKQISSSTYYLLSSSPNEGDGLSFQQTTQLYGCYGGPPTMHTPSLWLPPHNIESVNSLVSYWRRILGSRGCASLLDQGVQMVSQALVLSFAGVQHKQGYLQLALNPAQAQADIDIHNVHYGAHRVTIGVRLIHYSSTHELHISASPGLTMWPPRAGRMISAHQPVSTVGHGFPQLWACPSHCHSAPLMLSSRVVKFPIIATSPVTPILYISVNRQSLLGLKTTTSPPHVFHVAAGHIMRHIRRYGIHTVHPAIWFLLIAVLAAFHFFLIRIVYREYSSGDDTSFDVPHYRQNRYRYQRAVVNY